MRPFHFAVLLVATAALACASTNVTQRQSDMQPGEKLARPNHIIVHDFSATPEEVPVDSSISDDVKAQTTPPSEKELEVGRKLGESVARNLVDEIQKLGLPAVRVADVPTPAVGDIVFRGYFVTVDTGSAVERVAIGFGSGAAELTTVVEGYQQTETGMRRLGRGEVKSGGGAKGPGMIVPLAVTLVTANPIGLAVGGAVKAATELSGADTIEGSGRRTAELIAEELKIKFQEQGWIE